MRLLIQRVQEVHLYIHTSLHSEIGKGLLVFLGIHQDDTLSQIQWLVNKLVNLRIFSDEAGKMNRSIKDIDGQIMVVSQFTLYGNCLNGRRPDFIQAAPPKIAEPLYEEFIRQVKKEVQKVQTGVFGAEMKIALINDGPVTFLIDSEKK